MSPIYKLLTAKQAREEERNSLALKGEVDLSLILQTFYYQSKNLQDYYREQNFGSELQQICLNCCRRAGHTTAIVDLMPHLDNDWVITSFGMTAAENIKNRFIVGNLSDVVHNSPKTLKTTKASFTFLSHRALGPSHLTGLELEGVIIDNACHVPQNDKNEILSFVVPRLNGKYRYFMWIG